MNPQRFLALAGLGSRRACDKLIREGRVSVNGAVIGFGVQIQPGDSVVVNGARIGAPRSFEYIALNKPHGLISDRGMPNALSALDLPGLPAGLHAVGRLDKDATGLLLLTNDGDLSFHLAHPSFEHEKEYHVLVDGVPTEAALRHWRRGIDLEGERTAPARVSALPAQLETSGNASQQVRAATRRPAPKDATWLKVILREGRKRQIKKVAKQLGHPVRSLTRVRIGSLLLGTLKPGQWRVLSQDEVKKLREGGAHQPA